MARCIENVDFDEKINEDYDADWMMVAWWRNKTGLLKAKESSNTPNFEKDDEVLVRLESSN